MRHVLVHDYFGIDLPLVWAVVEGHLSSLREDVGRLLVTLGSSRSGAPLSATRRRRTAIERVMNDCAPNGVVVVAKLSRMRRARARGSIFIARR